MIEFYTWLGISSFVDNSEADCMFCSNSESLLKMGYWQMAIVENSPFQWTRGRG